MSLKPVCGIPQESSPAPFSVPTLWGPEAQRRVEPLVPFLEAGGGTGCDLQTNEHPHSASPLQTRVSSCPPHQRAGTLQLPTSHGHPLRPSLRLPPASWEQSMHGGEKPNTRAYNLPSTLRSARFGCASWGQSVSPSGLQFPTLSEE